MAEPNYKNYSLEELYDAFNHIDKVQFPERMKRLEVEIANRKDKSKKYEPTQLSSAQKKSSNKTGLSAFFERFRVKDLNSAEKAIKRAWIAGFLIAFLILAQTFLVLNGVLIFSNQNHSAYFNLFDVIFVVGLSIGIYRKSRECAILLLGYIFLSYILQLYREGTSYFGTVRTIIVYFLYQGILGTFKYKQLNPRIEQEYIDKVCPSCNDRNHGANIRCKCGFEFEQPNYAEDQIQH